jgi:hypothetical protein
MNALNAILNSLPGANEAWVTGLGFLLLGVATKVNDNLLSAAWHFDDTWVQTAVGLLTFLIVHGVAKARTQTIQQKQGVS